LQFDSRAGKKMSSANDKLVDAARDGDVAEIERQIAAGADPNALVDDWTPLQRAAANGHIAAIAALLKAGARVDGANSYGCTPLMWAAANGHTAAVDALVAAGADVHRADMYGNTALNDASAYGRLDAARVLLEAGARADVRNEDGKRPIDEVRAAFTRSLRLLDCGTPLCRRVAMHRFARWPATSPTRRPCAHCWRRHPP
jgi:ankyrin repeat protein